MSCEVELMMAFTPLFTCEVERLVVPKFAIVTVYALLLRGS